MVKDGLITYGQREKHSKNVRPALAVFTPFSLKVAWSGMSLIWPSVAWLHENTPLNYHHKLTNPFEYTNKSKFFLPRLWNLFFFFNHKSPVINLKPLPLVLSCLRRSLSSRRRHDPHAPLPCHPRHPSRVREPRPKRYCTHYD